MRNLLPTRAIHELETIAEAGLNQHLRVDEKLESATTMYLVGRPRYAVMVEQEGDTNNRGWYMWQG